MSGGILLHPPGITWCLEGVDKGKIWEYHEGTQELLMASNHPQNPPPKYTPGSPFPKKLNDAAMKQLLNAKPNQDALQKALEIVNLPVVNGERFGF